MSGPRLASFFSRRNVITALLLAASLTTIAAIFMHRESAATRSVDAARFESATINTPRPGFTLRDVDGIPRTVDAWDGKVLVLNFWATWCQPCLREIPLFNRLQSEHGDAGLQFVGIAVDDLDAVREFLKTQTVAYPILAGQQDAIDIAQNYGNDIGVLPYTAIVDRSGRIRFVQFGELPETLARDMIQPLL